MSRVLRTTQAVLTAFVICLAFASATPSRAADQDKLRAFLNVTGFDVALESIRLSADSAPQMLGVEADDFGSEWKRLVSDVFDTDVMHDMALDLLGQTLSDAALSHAAIFYASDLGMRLVEKENHSHLDDSETKRVLGEQIVAQLQRDDDTRLAILRRLNAASGGEDQYIRAIQEVQVRFLMAASGAGVIDLTMDEKGLRGFLATQEPEMRASIKASALTTAASTYRDFTDAELVEYAQALEHPTMQEVYALMNAVQFEIMANRFEAVAARLSAMQPSEEL